MGSAVKDAGTLSVLHRDLAECIRLLIKFEQDAAPEVIHNNLHSGDNGGSIASAESTSFARPRTSSTTSVDLSSVLSPEEVKEYRLGEAMENYKLAALLDRDGMRQAHVLRMDHFYQRNRSDIASYHFNELKRLLPNELTLKYDLGFLEELKK